MIGAGMVNWGIEHTIIKTVEVHDYSVRLEDGTVVEQYAKQFIDMGKEIQKKSKAKSE